MNRKFILLCTLLSGVTAPEIYASDSFMKPEPLSVDLSKCQYGQATGESEKLATYEGNFIRNGNFSENNTKSWNPKLAAGSTFKIDAGSESAELKSSSKTVSSISQTAEIPDSKKSEPAEFAVTASGDGASDLSLKVRIGFYKSDGSEARPAREQKIALSREWKTTKIEMMIPAGTSNVSCTANVTGTGKVKLKKIAICKDGMTQWVSTRLFPAAFVDNVVAVEEGEVGFLTFAFKNIRRERPRPAVIVLSLPKGFSIAATSPSLKLLKTEQKTDSTRYLLEDRLHGYSDYTALHSASVILKSELKSSEKQYPATYWMEYCGNRTVPYTTYLKVIPPFGKARIPSRFLTGLIGTNDIIYDDVNNGAGIYMNYLRKTGFTSGQLPPYPPLSKAAKKAGIERLWSDWWFVNGYTLGKEKKPEHAIFRDVDGKPWIRTQWHEGLCPVEAYTQGKYFKDHVIGYVEDRIFKNDLGDHVIANWEPIDYDFKGCFCIRCRDEFIRYTKLSKSEVEKKWPKEIIASYRAQWIKFRSWQHAKLMEAIRLGLDELGKKYGRRIHFIPEVAWSNLFDKESSMYDQYTLMDYLDKLQWINPWGPYIFQQYSAPFVYKAGVNLNTYVAARKMKELVAKYVPDEKKRPKLLAFPHGLQCAKWVTTPEAIAYETLAFFVNQWEGSYVYLFPNGYDARYYKTITDANNKIAHYEDFTFNGKRGKFAATEILTPLPGPAYIDSADNPSTACIADEIAGEKLVTFDSYQLGDRMMIAVGNAWARGEAYVKIAVPGLDPKKKYVVWSPDLNVNFGTDMTARQIADGRILHVKRLGWSFFVIEPFEKGKNYGASISQSAITSAMKKRIPVLERLFREDQELIKASNEIVLYNFGAAPALNNGTFKAAPKGGDLTSSVLSIHTPGYQAELDMGAGGRISAWSADGVLYTDAESGGMMRDGFWNPVNAIFINQGAYRFAKWEAVKDGIAIELEGVVNPKQNQHLKGLTIQKRYTFRKKEIQLDVTILNLSSQEFDAAYRLHNMPVFSGKNGTFSFDGKPQSRTGKDRFFSFVKNQLAAPPFGLQNQPVFEQNKFTFSGYNKHLDMTVLTPDLLQGVYVWDAPRSPYYSFEIFFKRTKLAKQQSVTFSFITKIRN